MRRNIPTFFAILLLGTLILCSACTSGTGNSADGGLSQVTTEEQSPFISFDEAKQAFSDYTGTGNGGEKVPVYYLLARNMDRSGNALSWLFGVHQDNGTALLIFDRSGWKVNPWNATLPADVIPLDTIVPPAALFTTNRDAIFGTASQGQTMDLALKQGKYTLTIRSGSTSRTLTFDAATGGT